MDDVHGDSKWTIMSNVIAHTDRIWNEDFHSVLALSAALIFYALAGTRLDIICNVAFLAYLKRSVLLLCITITIQHLSELFIFLLVALASYLLFASRRRDQSTSNWQGPGQPYLIPCKTTHRRFFPEKHSFSYSYLTVGVPVGYKGSANGMIEIDEQSSSPSGSKSTFAKLLTQSWYRIQVSDHLERGHNELDLRGKLDRYLQSEVIIPAISSSFSTDTNKGVTPTDFPYVYLVTAARFAGYNFNPVSLWYLYSSNKTLSGIVLEVNNTFDERRPYLVLRDFTAESSGMIPVRRSRVKGSRVKDFHVSPFSSRKGYYSVLANDPLGVGMNGCCGIDVTITLNSSKGTPKLVARLFSEGQAVNPIALSSLYKVTFLASWFWVGFATVPRIFKEAIVLSYRRKLHMWNTPVPLMATLGRDSTSVEKSLESCFRKYLESLVRQSKKPLLLKYCTTGLLSATEAMWASPRCQGIQNIDILELRILTPAFYTRFIQYVDSLDAMTTELNENRTIWASKPELLADVFVKAGAAPLSMGFADFVFVSVVKHIRQRPTKIPPVLTSADPPDTETLKIQVRDARVPSSMEKYIIAHEDSAITRQYQWATLRQLVADYYFMGRIDFLNQMANIVRILIASVCAASLIHITRGRH
jgi:DUF1365 family protein